MASVVPFLLIKKTMSAQFYFLHNAQNRIELINIEQYMYKHMLHHYNSYFFRYCLIIDMFFCLNIFINFVYD
jgi:hypothetical protein